MDTTHIQQKLQEELGIVEKELGELGQKNALTGEWETTMGAIDTTATEPDEIADRMEEFEERQDEIQGLIARKDDILRALEKITAGTYGTCEVCGSPIEKDRLDANPAARTCVAHA